MIPAKKVYSEPIETNSRLADLGLKEELLIEAVERGLAAWASCTVNYPIQFPGIYAWAETIAGLRERLLLIGWKRSNEGNLALTLNRMETLALTVATGDEFTGNPGPGIEPCTKFSKGPRTRSVVLENEGQYKLFPDMRLTAEDYRSLNSRETWMLLIHRDQQAQEVRCELSRPINVNDEGKVDGWAERIILKIVPFGGDVLEVPDGEIPQTPTIAVNINRRA